MKRLVLLLLVILVGVQDSTSEQFRPLLKETGKG